jgi:threonine synthase
LTESRGKTITVTEGEIASAMRELGQDFGLFVEPTSAVAVATIR